MVTSLRKESVSPLALIILGQLVCGSPISIFSSFFPRFAVENYQCKHFKLLLNSFKAALNSNTNHNVAPLAPLLQTIFSSQFNLVSATSTFQMSACHSFLLNSNVNERKVLFDLTDRVTDRMRRRALKKWSKKWGRKSEDTHHICAPFKLPKELNTSMQFCF